jgi:hypothetical protein
MQVDPVLERYGPPVTAELPHWLGDARARVRESVGLLLGLDEGDLAHRWWWRDDRKGGAEARYAFFRVIETFEVAAATARRAVDGADRPAGHWPFAAATVARWDLHGILASLTDADLDRDPGGDEWTIRQTLAHAVNVGRAYPAWSAWWLAREQTGELPAAAPDEVGEGFPDEDADGTGSLAEIAARLDASMDGAAARMAKLDDKQLAAPARWSGYAVDVGFRLWRQSSHLQEHTIQVEKTLVMLDRTPAEAQRLARLALRAFGRLESAVFALPAHLADRAESPVEAAAATAADVAAHVRAAGSVDRA